MKSFRFTLENIFKFLCTLDYGWLPTTLCSISCDCHLTAPSHVFSHLTAPSHVFPCPSEKDDHKQKLDELSLQVEQILEQNRTLQLENEEIPLLRDSVEEMKYLESKVVS